MAVQVTTLSNGVRVAVDPMPGLMTAAVGVWAAAGARHEGDGQHGAAHLLEHMAFKGTGTRSARAIAEEIESVGGHLNAATGYERTGYFARVLSGDVPLALDLLFDILADPAFAEDELTREQNVVLQEIGEAKDEPGDVVFENLQALAWSGSSLGRPILGTADSVLAQTPDSLRRFIADRYGPEHIVVTAAGGVDAEAFAAEVEKRFAAWPYKGAPLKTAAAFTGGETAERRDLEQTHLALAMPGVGVLDPGHYAFRVFAEALGGGMSSRLFQTIREERGLAYSVYAYADTYQDIGALGVYAGTAPKDAGAVPDLVRAEIEVVANSPEDAEIARAKAQLKSAILMAEESPAARADMLAGQILVLGAPLTGAEAAARVDAVTPDEVKAAAETALSAPAALSKVGPS